MRRGGGEQERKQEKGQKAEAFIKKKGEVKKGKKGGETGGNVKPNREGGRREKKEGDGKKG